MSIHQRPGAACQGSLMVSSSEVWAASIVWMVTMMSHGFAAVTGARSAIENVYFAAPSRRSGGGVPHGTGGLPDRRYRDDIDPPGGVQVDRQRDRRVGQLDHGVAGELHDGGADREPRRRDRRFVESGLLDERGDGAGPREGPARDLDLEHRAGDGAEVRARRVGEEVVPDWRSGARGCRECDRELLRVDAPWTCPRSR